MIQMSTDDESRRVKAMAGLLKMMGEMYRPNAVPSFIGAERAVNLLDIQRYLKSSPFILSGGERKRVALASVLAWNPEVLVLDEPTVGQDYGQKERLKHFLVQLRTQGKTVVIVTHDVEFVAMSQPRIVLMAQGRIVADGPTKQIMTDNKSLEICSVAPPEVTKLFTLLSKHGFPSDILDVDEATDLLTRRMRK
jgi:energy-coupling factor transport system ATP-binding protein